MLDHAIVGLQLLLLPGFFVALVLAIPTLAVLRRSSRVSTFDGGLLMFSLAMCGYLLGAIGGNSTSPVAAPIITGLVGFIGTLVAVLHGKDTEGDTSLRPVASVGLVVLICAIFVGLIIGGAYQRRFDPPAPDPHAAHREAVVSGYWIPYCLEEAKRVLEGQIPRASDECRRLRAVID